MKYKIIYIMLVVAAACTTATAQNLRTAHEQAHRGLLANHKSEINMGMIEGLIEDEVLTRERNISAEAAAEIEDILREAKTHIGKKYVHATRGPNTFDCSGFTHYVFKQFGYNVSPGVRFQYAEQGVKVDRKNARKGDLIYFTSRSSGNNAGHVGIITDIDRETGEISFIHASLKGVRISKVEGYYANRFIGIKRVIN